MLNKIILASKSKVRKEILDKHKIFCEAKPSNIDEDIVKETLIKEFASPETISKNLAELKANKVSLSQRDKIVIGSRGSKLALIYAEKVKSKLIDNCSKKIEIKTIVTEGDVNQKDRLSEVGGKGLFSKNIESELLENKIDLAVHALKDMPGIETKGLVTNCFLERNYPNESKLMFKAASGAIEYMNIFEVSNINSTLKNLKDKNFWIYGFDGNGDKKFTDIEWKGNNILLFGSEGSGMHQHTSKYADFLLRIDINKKIESLNISNSAAIVFHYIDYVKK